MSDHRRTLTKLAVFVALAATVAVLLLVFRDRLNWETLVRHEQRLRTYRRQHPVLLHGAAFLLYVVVTGLSIPVANILTLTYGWLFGFWRALVLVSFGSTLGATVAFLLSRHLLRDLVRARFGERLQQFDAAMRREGPFCLFLLRLTPVVPFWMINLLMGLTPISVITFWWVSQIGMLPATAIHVAAGSTVPSLEQLAERGVAGLLTWPVILAFLALGIFPLVVRKLASRFQNRRAGRD